MLPSTSVPKTLLVGLAALTFSSCDGAPSNPPSPESQTIPVSPTNTASPLPGTPNPEPGFMTQPTSCDTANYYAEVVWEGQQPFITLVQKPAPANGYQTTTNLNRAAATRTANNDGSVTFGSPLEGGIIYTRVFPNGTCFIQSVATATGTVVFEENGRIQGNSAQTTTPTQPLPQRPVTDPVRPTPPPTQQRPITDPIGPTTPPTQQRPVTDPVGPTTPTLQRPSVPESAPPNLQR